MPASHHAMTLSKTSWSHTSWQASLTCMLIRCGPSVSSQEDPLLWLLLLALRWFFFFLASYCCWEMGGAGRATNSFPTIVLSSVGC